MSAPFTYPPAPHERRHGPLGYADSQSYRPWLRDEFCFRCVYCLLREQWGQFRGGHTIDHFLPIAHHPTGRTDFDNLFYACAICNAAKGNRRIPDPGAVLTAPEVWVSSDGVIHASTAEAAKLIELLGLDSGQSTELRMLWIDIITLAQSNDPALYLRLVGFPDDIPDLRRLRPPGGNSRPEGLIESFFALRAQGKLPGTY